MSLTSPISTLIHNHKHSRWYSSCSRRRVALLPSKCIACSYLMIKGLLPVVNRRDAGQDFSSTRQTWCKLFQQLTNRAANIKLPWFSQTWCNSWSQQHAWCNLTTNLESATCIKSVAFLTVYPLSKLSRSFSPRLSSNAYLPTSFDQIIIKLSPLNPRRHKTAVTAIILILCITRLYVALH